MSNKRKQEELNESDEIEILNKKKKKINKEELNEIQEFNEKQELNEENKEEFNEKKSSKEKEYNKTYRKNYTEMSKEDSDERLEFHLTYIHMLKYLNLFLEEEIRMKHFWHLTEKELRDIGVKLGDAKEITKYTKNVIAKNKNKVIF